MPLPSALLARLKKRGIVNSDQKGMLMKKDIKVLLIQFISHFSSRGSFCGKS